MPFDANPLMLAGRIAMSYGKKQDQDEGGGGMRAPGDDPREAGLRAAGFGPAKLSPDAPAQIDRPFGMKPRAFNEYGDELPYQPGSEQPGSEEPEGYEDPGESETDRQNRRLTARNMKKKPSGRTLWDLFRG
jgi:hypothetical protein